MKKTKAMALFLAALILLSMAGACTGNGGSSSPTQDAADTTAPTVVTPAEPEPTEEETSGSIFPLAETITLAVYTGIDTAIGQYVIDPAEDMRVWRELSERMNIEFDFTVNTDEALGLQLIVVSGDYGDLLSNMDTYYIGGAEVAINDEVIIDLMPYIDQMPNYYETVLSNSDLLRDIVTDSGYLPQFALVYESNYGIMSGPSIRQDWLDDLSLDMPVTYDDWREALAMFKTEKGADFALALSGTGVCTAENLSSGFGVRMQYTTDTFNSSPFYIEGGKGGTVKFGPIQEGCLEYLTMLNEWYSEGLISSDFVSYTGWIVPDDATINGRVGVAFGNPNKMIMWAEQSDDPNMLWAPIADPTKDGIGKEYVNHNKSRVSGPGFSITTQCEYLDIAIALLDYGYSDEGYILWNYGILGEGLEYDQAGNPQLTDLVLKNPDGIESTNAAAIYASAVTGSFVVNMNRFNRYYTYEQSIAQGIWNSTNDSSDNWAYPTNAAMTAQENERYDQLMSDILTYISENFLAFIMGEQPLDYFDTFVATIEGMGIEEIVAIKQAALDRYMS